MNDLPRQKLIEIVADRQAVLARTGRDVTIDAKLCEALLRDLCGEYRREIAVLVAAQKERVAADLLSSQGGVPRQVLLTRLTRRLQDNLGLTEEAASWAVDSWALALGPKLPQPAAPPLPPPHARAVPWGCWIVGGLAVMAVLIFALISAPKQPPPPPPATPTSARSTIATAPAAVPPAVLPTLPPAPTAVPPTPTPTPTDTPTPTPTPTPTQAKRIDVPSGVFRMGAASSDTQASSDEIPQHTVYLDGFQIDQTEVTNAMFKKFIDATNYQTDAEKQGNGLVYDTAKQTWSDMQGANWQHPHGPGSNLNGLDDHPVVQISWNDATAYCRWAGGDLPTEAQWEKAARGIDGRIYPWGDQAPAGNFLNSADRSLDVTWADKSIDDGYQFTAPVGHYPAGASPYGALDMAGNVWEWVRDWYDDKYYASSPARNSENTTESGARILRGGSWNNGVLDLRASNRLPSSPVKRDEVFGFRCAY